MAIVSVQNPVILNDFTEPQPDIVVLRPSDDFYAKALPGPSEVLLLILKWPTRICEYGQRRRYIGG